MSKTQISSRFIQKHDLEINWLKAVNFVPMQGELIVYDIEVDENGDVLKISDGNGGQIDCLPRNEEGSLLRATPYTYERFKIGDGIKNVNDLPFAADLTTNNVSIDTNGYLYIASQGLSFSIDGDIAIVTGIGDCTDTDIIIPSKYNGKSVTRIREGAFQDCINLISIKVPNSVLSIGEGAFSGCAALKSIILPFIGGSHAAAKWQGHFGYIFGYSISDDGSSADYHYCDTSQSPYRYFTYHIPTSLESVTISDGVISIDNYAFHNCMNLKNITIPDSVTAISNSAFASCHGLTSIEIPDSVTSIGFQAFHGCRSLTSIIIPDSVTSIGHWAFGYCHGLTSVVIPDSVTSIDASAFHGCRSLTSIIIPDSVTSIGSDAFYECYALTIYCEAENKLEGWNSNWNSSNRPVIWSFAGDFIAADNTYFKKSDAATVATTGSYDDLTNKPTIPIKVSELENDSGYAKTTNVNTSISIAVNNLRGDLKTDIEQKTEIIDVPELPTPTSVEELLTYQNKLYRTNKAEGTLIAMNGAIAGQIDMEVPATVFVVPTLPEVGNASTEEHYYIYFCVSDGAFYYGTGVVGYWGTYFFNLPIVQSRDDVAQLMDCVAFLPESTTSDMYALNPLATIDGEHFVNISDAIIAVDELPVVPDSGKIYRISEEATYGTLYIKNEDDSLSINTFEGTPVNILIVDTLPEQYKYSTTAEAFIYYQKSDNKLYWMLIENDGWMELSESGIPYQIITSTDEILVPGYPYIIVPGEGVKHVEGGLYIWDGEWKTLTTSDILEDELNNKASTMLAADKKRLAAYEGSTRRPFDQSLFDVLKNQSRVYVESGNYGGVYPVIALTDTGEGRVFNPWGFNTLEDMFNGQHWPISWDGNIITEATTDNPTGWYKVIRDESGNAISYHPTLGTIVQRYNDGNIRVPQNPRDSRDAASKAYVDSKSSASTSYTNTKFNEAKAYTDANSFANPNIDTYGFTYKGSNGLGSIPYCSDDSPNSTDASIRSNTAVVRTKVGEVMCITNDSSKKQAAVNKQFLEEQLANQADVIIDEVNNNVAPEIVAQAAQITANAVVESKTGNELILRDINPNASTIFIHTEPNITVRACTPVVYSKDRLPVSNTNAYGSGYADIYPPKHQRYKLSCSFENPNNNNIALVAKLDDSGNGYVASSSATSGDLSVIVDLTEKTYVNKIRLRFYSNYSGSVASASDVVFSNIKFELTDETVDKEGASTTTSTQGTTDENGNLILAIPDWSPIVVYNIQDYEMEVTYNQNLNSKFNTYYDKTKIDDLLVKIESIPPLEFTSNGDGTCSVTGIGECFGKEKIVLPVISPSGDYVTRIGAEAFLYCHNLTEITIPESIISIGNNAFNNCTNLVDVTIPDSVTQMGYGIFSGCSNLRKLKIPFVGANKEATSPSASTCFGYIFSTGPYTESYRAEQRYEDLDEFTYGATDYYIPKTLDTIIITGGKILRGALGNIRGKIAIGQNVTYFNSTDNDYRYIGHYITDITKWCQTSSVNTWVIGAVETFYLDAEENYLTKLVIPDTVRDIRSEAFMLCKSLRSVIIPSTVVNIGSSAFSYCENLIEVINRSSLNIVAGDSSYGGIGEYAIEVHTGASKLVNKDGYLFYTYDGVNYLLGYTGTDTDLILPDNYNGEDYEIYHHAFRDCSALTSIEIPDSVTSIGNDAFYGCNRLKIYCEAEAKPSTWDSQWNSSNRPVVWGFAGDFFKANDIYAKKSEISSNLKINVTNQDYEVSDRVYFEFGSNIRIDASNADDGMPVLRWIIEGLDEFALKAGQWVEFDANTALSIAEDGVYEVSVLICNDSNTAFHYLYNFIYDKELLYQLSSPTSEVSIGLDENLGAQFDAGTLTVNLQYEQASIFISTTHTNYRLKVRKIRDI